MTGPACDLCDSPDAQVVGGQALCRGCEAEERLMAAARILLGDGPLEMRRLGDRDGAARWKITMGMRRVEIAVWPLS